MKKKNIMIILVLLGIYFAIMLIIFLPQYIHKKNDNLYILSGGIIKIKYENGEWNNIDDFSDYKFNIFAVYENNQFKGNYKLLYSNRYYLYGPDGKSVDYNGDFFAYRGTIKFAPYGISNIKEVTEKDRSVFTKLFNELGISYTEEFNLFQKNSLDIDNDGIIESIYSITNYYVYDVPDKAFSVVFIEKNNEITIIDKKIINSIDIYNEPSFEIHQVFDIKDDKKMEILYTKNYFGRPNDECVIITNLYSNRKVLANFCN